MAKVVAVDDLARFIPTVAPEIRFQVTSWVFVVSSADGYVQYFGLTTLVPGCILEAQPGLREVQSLRVVSPPLSCTSVCLATA